MKGLPGSQLTDIKNALKGSGVTHVLLDMDGTLLDKYFDDYFWGRLVPEKYAEKHRMTLAQAHAELYEKYKAQEERKLGFKKSSALFVDDTLEVLKTAGRFGLSLLVYKARATSKAEPLPSAEFASIHDFDELLGFDKQAGG